MKAEFIVIQERLKEARNIQKITQRELAEICNVSEKTISRAEREADKLEFETLSFIADKLKIKIEGYLYKQASSLDLASSVIKELSKGGELKVHPVDFNIEKLDIVIRITEILERSLKDKPYSTRLRAQRSLLLENEKLKEAGGEGFYTVFLEDGIRVLNLYFVSKECKKIKSSKGKRYIEVFKEGIH